VILGKQDELNAQQLRDFFGDEAKVAELNQRLDAYAEEYLSQIILNG